MGGEKGGGGQRALKHPLPLGFTALLCQTAGERNPRHNGQRWAQCLIVTAPGRAAPHQGSAPPNRHGCVGVTPLPSCPSWRCPLGVTPPPPRDVAPCSLRAAPRIPKRAASGRCPATVLHIWTVCGATSGRPPRAEAKIWAPPQWAAPPPHSWTPPEREWLHIWIPSHGRAPHLDTPPPPIIGPQNWDELPHRHPASGHPDKAALRIWAPPHRNTSHLGAPITPCPITGHPPHNRTPHLGTPDKGITSYLGTTHSNTPHLGTPIGQHLDTPHSKTPHLGTPTAPRPIPGTPP